MKSTVVERVKIRLRQFHIEEIGGVSTKVFDNPEDNPIIEECIDTNIDWLCSKLGKEYSSFSESEFYDKYSSALVELTLFDMSREGAEYQETHNENGVSRKFYSKDDVFNSLGLFSFIKII